MKKFLLIGTLLLSTAGITIAANKTYSQTYIDNFKSCTPSSETFSTDIKTQDPNTPVIYLESKEIITGRQGGKCLTKSMVYNITKQTDGTINREKVLTVDCRFTDEQLNKITSKMQSSQTSPEAQAQLQQTMTQYVKDPEVCTITNQLQPQE